MGNPEAESSNIHQDQAGNKTMSKFSIWSRYRAMITATARLTTIRTRNSTSRISPSNPATTTARIHNTSKTTLQITSSSSNSSNHLRHNSKSSNRSHRNSNSSNSRRSKSNSSNRTRNSTSHISPSNPATTMARIHNTSKTTLQITSSSSNSSNCSRRNSNSSNRSRRNSNSSNRRRSNSNSSNHLSSSSSSSSLAMRRTRRRNSTSSIPAAPPPQPVAQFPPQSPQMNPAHANQGPYPQQQQPPSYPPTVATPQQYPLAQQQPQHAQQSAAQPYPLNLPPMKPSFPSPAFQQQPATQPMQFPPPAGGEAQYATVAPPLVKQGDQGNNGAAQGIPVQANMIGAVNTQGWSTGLFDCMDDPMNAAVTFFFPFLTFGQIAEIIDGGTTSCAMGGLMYVLVGGYIGMSWIYSCTYRSKLRSKFGLVESPAPDWIVHSLCEPCALCQEYRELNRRGLEPSIGWSGNVRKQHETQQQPQVAMMPPTNQTMMA